LGIAIESWALKEMGGREMVLGKGNKSKRWEERKKMAMRCKQKEIM